MRADLGYLGCRSDVLNLADARCSGKIECDIRVPDGDFDRTLEFVSLEVSCVI